MELKIEPGSLFLIAGPCVVESEDIVRSIGKEVKSICDDLGIPFILKASYRKANRSSSHSFTGIGDTRALEILANAANSLGVACTTDIHTDEEAALAAGFVDILQIPAFLCRQTSLLVAAAETGKYVNIKKGQFMSPGAMVHAVEKVRKAGNDHIFLTERGTSFGYQDLIVDYRGIPEMQNFGVPVIMDCTHSLQQPNQASGVTGGRPDLIPTIARAAVAAGVDGLFIETHPSPKDALSDGANMLPLDQLATLLSSLVKIHKAVNEVS